MTVLIAILSHLNRYLIALEAEEIKYIEADSGRQNWKGRSTVDQIFTLREIQAESYEYGKQTMLLFIDFQQAYDKVKRTEVFRALTELGVGKKLTKMIKLTIQEAGRIKTGGYTPVLCSVVLEKIIKDAGINREGLLYTKRHQCLVFADYLVILARDRKELTKRLENQAQKVGLVFNEKKTKFMVWSARDFEKGRCLQLNYERGKRYKFEVEDTFTYLGAVYLRNPNVTQEFMARIMTGNRCVSALQKIIKSKNISRSLKSECTEQ
ncbi:uncharacterized protein LOC115874180 [Sitophilus oryzae]|uniref:Uncharacterized protein LOC115874180 n=1 Tax=Sitophilus oryzae TaxID=7048 RepID=A0A6J2X1Y2_SITOR|nr:uncharacterized protein LOC115874180 [Sitophilus oryzae]